MIALLLAWAVIRKLRDLREQLERSFDEAFTDEAATWWPAPTEEAA